MLFSSRLVELSTLGNPRTRGSPPSLTHSGSLRTQLASVRERKAKHLNYFLILRLNSFEFCFLILEMEIMLLSPPMVVFSNEVTLACSVHSTGRQSTDLENGCIMGSWGSFCACLMRTQPWLTLACVDRTFSTAGSASAVDTAWRMVAPVRPAPAAVVEGASHQGALMPSPRGEGSTKHS